MKIYDDIELADHTEKVVTLGNFDGVHLGHQKLISKTVEIASEKKMTSCVLSFYPHPRLYFNQEIKVINPLPEKIDNISRLGVSALITLKFTKEIASLSKEAFVKDILHQKLHAKVIVVGYNFRFGHKRSGSVEDLCQIAKRFGIETKIIPPVVIDGKVVSSSLIREYFELGEIEAIKKNTGFYPKVSGLIKKGRQLGRTIGFPTANVDYPKGQLLPSNGVYAVECLLNDKKYKGVANIGVNPTVKQDQKVMLEVYLFNFSQDIYDKNMAVIFIRKIRDEQTFPSLLQLQKKIEEDAETAKNILQ